MALRRFEDFALLLDDLEKFSNAMESLVHGFLSPGLVSPTELQHTLVTVSYRLQRLGGDLRVLRASKTFYYGARHFLATRAGDRIIINLHAPIGNLPGKLSLYKIHVYVVCHQT